MATITRKKRKKGTTYRVQVRKKGVYEAATFTKLEHAKRWASQTENAIEEGTYFATAEAKRHTVGEHLDRYVDTVLFKTENGEMIPQRKSASDQKRVLLWWKGKIGDKKLSDVTPALLGEIKDELAKQPTRAGGTMQPGTVNRYLAYLGSAFTTALREWQWITSNPVGRVSKLTEPKGRIRFLDDKERKDLLAACKEVDEALLYPMVVTAISTGARQGELLGLRWRDVDFERGVAIAHDTKNGETRAMPLTGPAVDLLMKRKKSQPRQLDKDRDFVFGNKDGKVSFPEWSWRTARDKAELEDFRWHDLRHCTASYLAMSGASLMEIADVLGHKTLTMVQRYSHLTAQHTKTVAARMTDKFLSEVK